MICPGQIVDFCCGANDFSSLVKQKLDKIGKKCSFKNYDLFRPKVFSFSLVSCHSVMHCYMECTPFVLMYTCVYVLVIRRIVTGLLF